MVNIVNLIFSIIESLKMNFVGVLDTVQPDLTKC